MLKYEKINFFYINVRHEIRSLRMNGILAKSTEDRTNNIRSSKPAESIETAGSLASNQFHSLFETNSYDEFSTSNPFAVDYSQYSDAGETVAYTGGFLSSFSNAVSTLSSSGGFSSAGSFSGGASCAGASAGSTGGSCSGGGGFSSVC